VETAATDGNPLEKRADSHSCLDKAEQNTCSALSTVTTGPAAINSRGWAKSDDQSGPNQVVKASDDQVTNFGWHFSREEGSPPGENCQARVEHPKYPLRNEIWELLGRALSEYGSVTDEEERGR
jgi:hypothetical protein